MCLNAFKDCFNFVAQLSWCLGRNPFTHQLHGLLPDAFIHFACFFLLGVVASIFLLLASWQRTEGMPRTFLQFGLHSRLCERFGG